MTTDTNTIDYDNATAAIERYVDALNEALGLDPTDYSNRVSFGYIGNLYGIPGTPAYRDDRYWSVFLPHPGRVGTAQDRIGGFATGDLDGARRTRDQLAGVVTFARWNNAR